MPKGFVPAVARAARSQTGRYFVVMRAASVAAAKKGARAAGRTYSGEQQRATSDAALRSQDSAIADARSRGGSIVFRYSKTLNAFSAKLSPEAAAALARRSDVARVEPVGIVRRANETSVPFIGAPAVWAKGFTGAGMRVALVDTGIDYTHKDFGGPGTEAAYLANDPDVIEPGSFPTAKVIGGYDFVGGNYDVLDADPSNDTPAPDPDPLDVDGHGTHTGGTCCGNGVPGKIGKGVAFESKLYAIKVWDVGNSTDDVLVAGYDFAVDPNGDGNTTDKADVLSFSGGVDYGTQHSTEALAAQGVVDIGTVFVASAGNSGNQPSGGAAYITGTPATAPGVIAVAASIDQFVAQTLAVNAPPGVTLPDNGLIVHQDWSGELTSDLTDDVFDARAVDPPSSPDGQPSPSDAQLCTPVSGTPFAGQIALVYKGSTGAGDCTGTEKVYNAQLAGAIAVILWNGFGGLPFGLGPGPNVELITIPAFMTSSDDSEALGAADSPAAPASYNTGGLNVTLHADPAVVPGFEDFMTDFTSEGPARVTSALKPDISAPGFDITSAAVGTGDDAAVLSGTSMAAPHVSGVATLIRQQHPTWTPLQIKSVLMNQATQAMHNNDGTAPVSATVMGAGRVRADESSDAVSLATPGSLSFGLQPRAGTISLVRSLTVSNLDSVNHAYSAAGTVRYTDYSGAVASVQVAKGGGAYGSSTSFNLTPGASQLVNVRLTLVPAAITTAEEEYGWYFNHPNIDGNVVITQTRGSTDELHVPWHVAPLAASSNQVSPTSLNVSTGPKTLSLQSQGAAGTDAADLYLRGSGDPKDLAGIYGEADIDVVGARSFTGGSIDGNPSGVPAGTDARAGITWQQFLSNEDFPAEPVEFGVRTFGVHNTTDTLEIDVLVDAGADGKFANQPLRADYLIVKTPGSSGTVCVYDLSQPAPFNECDAVYFADYSNYNANVVGLVVDAADIGLTNASPQLAYQVVACTGVFAGDVPQQVCDTAGGFAPGGTYNARLNATNPSLEISQLTCRGFFGGAPCNGAAPIQVSRGSATPGTTVNILALFPNNLPGSTRQLIPVRV
jgi:subtilisin family serine protease